MHLGSLSIYINSKNYHTERPSMPPAPWWMHGDSLNLSGMFLPWENRFTAQHQKTIWSLTGPLQAPRINAEWREKVTLERKQQLQKYVSSETVDLGKKNWKKRVKCSAEFCVFKISNKPTEQYRRQKPTMAKIKTFWNLTSFGVETKDIKLLKLFTRGKI